MPHEIDEAVANADAAIFAGERNGDPDQILGQLRKMREMLDWVRGAENGFSDLMDAWREIDARKKRATQ